MKVASSMPPSWPGKIGRFLRRYSMTMQALAVLLVMVLYPNLATRLNAPPAETETRTLEGVILRASRDSPNLLLRVPSGTAMRLDFPASLQGIYAGKPYPFTHLQQSDLDRLVGCKARLRVKDLEYVVIPSHPRVWSLECERLSISHETMANYYRSDLQFRAGDVFLCVLAVLMIWAGLIHDLKKRRSK